MNAVPTHNHTQKKTQKGREIRTATADPELLTLDELAARLKIHPVTARGLWRRRVIPGLKIGHRTLRFEYQAVLDALRETGDSTATQAE